MSGICRLRAIRAIHFSPTLIQTTGTDEFVPHNSDQQEDAMNIKRKLLAVAVGGSALLGSALALAPSAFATTTASPSPSVTGLVNGGYTGTYTHTTTTNPQWKTDSYSLLVTGSYGWTNTFTLQVQNPVSTNHNAPVVTGSVTDTTEYGTSTQSFTVPTALWQKNPVVPFGSADGQNITADNGNWYGIYFGTPGATLPASPSLATQSNDPAGWYMFNTEYNMVYFGGGQNAGYWFGL
jgi:hypothetical protein